MNLNEPERAMQTPAGRRVPQFLAETGLARTKLLTLPEPLRPRSVLIGRVRIITEQPGDWLERVGKTQADTGDAA